MNIKMGKVPFAVHNITLGSETTLTIVPPKTGMKYVAYPLSGTGTFDFATQTFTDTGSDTTVILAICKCEVL